MNESNLSFIAIILLVIALQFIINYKPKNKRIDALMDIVCILMTIALLSIGYFNDKDKWLFALITFSLMIILEIREINISKE